MGKPGRSGNRRYPYPVYVGDVLALQALTKRDYDRIRDAAYKRAEYREHILTVCWQRRKTVLIERLS